MRFIFLQPPSPCTENRLHESKVLVDGDGVGNDGDFFRGYGVGESYDRSGDDGDDGDFSL